MKFFRKAAAAAATFGFAALASVAALAAGADIHIGATKNQNGSPVVVFIFSDSDQSGFAPIDAFSIEIDDAGECLADFDASWEEFAENPGEPIYGPGSGRGTIDPNRLPTFFAGHTAKLLGETGMTNTAKETVPYHNCAGKVWATVLSQNPYE